MNLESTPLPQHATPLPHCRTHLFALATPEQARATVSHWQAILEPRQLGTLLADISNATITCCPAAAYARELTMSAARQAQPVTNPRPFSGGQRRCTTCNRASHEPGTWQGHAFTVTAEVDFSQPPSRDYTGPDYSVNHVS